MKKGKAWLRDEVFELYPNYGEMYVSPDYETVVKTETISKVLVLIDQLDEPEKPVIPQFVADWIERQKQPEWDYENKEDALADSIHFTIFSLKANYPETNSDVILRKPINEWLDDDRKNYWKLIDGVRYGYEVEKEKKYYVLNSHGKTILVKLFGKQIAPSQGRCVNDLGRHNSNYQFTEQEIKDYDKRYWVFAQEVTE